MKSARSAANGVVPKNTPSVLDIAPNVQIGLAEPVHCLLVTREYAGLDVDLVHKILRYN